MFHCERCRSSFNATVSASLGECPRCRARDGISSQLNFRLFEPEALRSAGLNPHAKPIPLDRPAPDAARAGSVENVARL